MSRYSFANEEDEHEEWMKDVDRWMENEYRKWVGEWSGKRAMNPTAPAWVPDVKVRLSLPEETNNIRRRRGRRVMRRW